MALGTRQFDNLISFHLISNRQTPLYCCIPPPASTVRYRVYRYIRVQAATWTSWTVLCPGCSARNPSWTHEKGDLGRKSAWGQEKQRNVVCATAVPDVHFVIARSIATRQRAQPQAPTDLGEKCHRQFASWLPPHAMANLK